MKLVDFHHTAPIFVDANIFTYFALCNSTFQVDCTAFIERIERGEIRAVTSTFVLNETYYALLIGKGSEVLNTTSLKRIKKSLVSDSLIVTKCYDVCEEFDDYVHVLQAKGLQVLEISQETLSLSLTLGKKYRLLPTDALHVATCRQMNITHIATADVHFDRIDDLHIWEP